MKSHRLLWVLRGLLVVIICLLASHFVQPVAAENMSAEYRDLQKQVEEEGQVRVIVTLALAKPYIPEGLLPKLEAQLQRRTIKVIQDQVVQQLARYGVNIYIQFDVFPMLAMDVNQDALQYLTNSPLVAQIAEDVAVPAELLSSTTVIGAPTVWGQGYTGAGQAVVILDTGIDSDHPFFTGRIATQRCFSNQNGTGTPGRFTSLCPNGTGYDTSANVEIAACTNATSGDLCTHGAHVAGIVAGADYSGGPGYNGVAPGASLIPIQVFTRFNQDSDCGGVGTAPCFRSFSSDQLNALQYVYTTLQPSYTIASVNMSLGGGQNTAACDGDSLKTAIDNLLSVGIVTAIASGNDGFTNAVSAPGCISTAVTVGATTDSDAVANFSNSSAQIDLLAPGVAIDSSIPDDLYGSKQGTSMATPHVAGAWAVLKQAAPGATPAQVLAALQQYGKSVTDSRNGLIRPRIQLDRAVAALLPATWVGNTVNWNTASNWSTGSVPRCGTPITIPTTPSGGNFPTVDSDATVGTVTIATGAQLNMAANTLTVCGDWIAQGTSQFNATGGTVIFASATTQSITQPAGSNGQFYNVQIGDGTLADAVTLNSDVTIAGNLTFRSPATLDANGRTLSIAGNWLDYGAGFAPNLGTVVFNSPTTQSVNNATFVLLNAPLNEGNGHGCCSSAYLPAGWVREQSAGLGFLGGDMAGLGGSDGAAVRWNNSVSAWLHTTGLALETGVNYELEYKYRSLFTDGSSHNFAVWLGTAQNAASMTTPLHQISNISSNVFTTAIQPFTVSSNGTYYLGLYSAQNTGAGYGVIDDVMVRATSTRSQFYNVRIDQGATAFAQNLIILNDLTIADGAGLTVEGTVTNSGRFIQTRGVPNSATTSFLNIQNAAHTVDRYFGVDITPSTGNMLATTVTIRGGQTCGTNGNLSNGVQRCYDINPASPQTATIRFYYRSAESNVNTAPSVFHYAGSNNWDLRSGNTRGGSGEGLWVQATGINAYSPFGLADVTPTIITLGRLTAASPTSGGWVMLALLLPLSVLGLIVSRRKTR